MKSAINFLTALFVFLVISCSTDKDDEQHLRATSCDQWAIIDAGNYNTVPGSPYIHSLKITEDCLSVTFSYGGCDGETWVVELLDSGKIAESLPPQRYLRLSIESQELCEALIIKEMSFDLRELQVQEGDEVVLNIQGAEEPVLYNY